MKSYFHHKNKIIIRSSLIKKKSKLNLFIIIVLLIFSSCNSDVQVLSNKSLTWAKNFNYVKKNNSEVEVYFNNSSNYTIKITNNKQPIKIVSLTNTVIPYLFVLDEMNSIIGLGEMNYIHNTEYKKILSKNACQNIGSNNQYNVEKIIELKPDIVFLSCAYQQEYQQKIQSYGINTVCFDEYLESHPLGVLEWIKLIGVFVNKQIQAEQYFDSVSQNYLTWKEKISKITIEKPNVMAGEEISGKWYIPGGNTYIANLIEDAGGNYVFKDYSANNSIALGLEEIIKRCSPSCYWRFVTYSTNSFSYSALKNLNQSYKNIPSVVDKKVIYSDANKHDIFGEAIVQPDIQLKDIAHILFFNQLPKGYQNKFYYHLAE